MPILYNLSSLAARLYRSALTRTEVDDDLDTAGIYTEEQVTADCPDLNEGNVLKCND